MKACNMMYSDKDCEKLVALANNDGFITYAQISKAFPDVDDSFHYDWVGDSFKSMSRALLNIDLRHLPSSDAQIMIYWVHCPDDYVNGYKFKPDDKFILSTSGKNLRHKLNKEKSQYRLAFIAAVASVISVIITIVLSFF